MDEDEVEKEDKVFESSRINSIGANDEQKYTDKFIDENNNS